MFPRIVVIFSGVKFFTLSLIDNLSQLLCDSFFSSLVRTALRLVIDFTYGVCSSSWLDHSAHLMMLLHLCHLYRLLNFLDDGRAFPRSLPRAHKASFLALVTWAHQVMIFLRISDGEMFTNPTQECGHLVKVATHFQKSHLHTSLFTRWVVYLAWCLISLLQPCLSWCGIYRAR